MSERDLRRIEALSEVRTSRRTVAAAAAVLAVSERQAYRLRAKYEVHGGSGLIHRARGQTIAGSSSVVNRVRCWCSSKTQRAS